jgi:hypothetical protein
MAYEKKYRASRFEYKTAKEAAAAIGRTKRGKGKNIIAMTTRHSNTEWIFCEEAKS